MKPSMVIKRDGQAVPFMMDRITDAILQAQIAVGIDDSAMAGELGRVVAEHIERSSDQAELGIEEIQDAVVHVLQESGNYETAIAYCRYRDARERFRRSRYLLGEGGARPNLMVIDLDGRRRLWDRSWLEPWLLDACQIEPKAVSDVLQLVEKDLADSALTEITAPLLLSLVDAALVRCGMHTTAESRAPLRVQRTVVTDILRDAAHGHQAVRTCGRRVLEQFTLSTVLPDQVRRLSCRGRLWIDGLDDPRRGSHLTVAIDGNANPWHVVSQAFAIAAEGTDTWRRTSLILPPSILGHLERGALALIKPLTSLASLAAVYLYCDGRTPLLDTWPFTGRSISIATYADDFLLLRRLQELGLPLLSGPHLMQGGFRQRITGEFALNAQGLENEYSQMDYLALGLVTAARVRVQQMDGDPALAGGDLRYAIYGLPADSIAMDYLDRQVVQESQRAGLCLSRTTHLPEEACAHLGRLLE